MVHICRSFKPELGFDKATGADYIRANRRFTGVFSEMEWKNEGKSRVYIGFGYRFAVGMCEGTAGGPVY